MNKHSQGGNHEAAKLRRKGWSAARIDRTLAARAEAARRRALRGASDLGAEEWLSLLRAVVVAVDAPYVGLLLHWYSGDVEREEFAIRRREAVPLTAASPDLLMRIDQDVLYEFRR